MRFSCSSQFVTIAPPEQDDLAILKLHLIRNSNSYNVLDNIKVAQATDPMTLGIKGLAESLCMCMIQRYNTKCSIYASTKFVTILLVIKFYFIIFSHMSKIYLMYLLVILIFLHYADHNLKNLIVS